MPYRILVAEDDTSISDLIAMTLEMNHHIPVCAADGKRAMEFIQNDHFDLALLDIMLPYYDGYELFKALQKKEVPAIFITAKDTLTDRVNGLRMGVEDYIIKPFEPLELLARVDNILRRIKRDEGLLQMHNISLDLNRRVVLSCGEPTNITPIEYELLELFMRNPGLVFTRDQLLDRVWGYDYFGGTRTVDMHVMRLRAKLGLEDAIQTVHKVGYRLIGDP